VDHHRAGAASDRTWRPSGRHGDPSRGAYLARNVAIVGAGNEGQRREEQDKSVVICGVFDDRYSIPGIMTHLKSRRLPIMFWTLISRLKVA
jgi:hypothetical protein